MRYLKLLLYGIIGLFIIAIIVENYEAFSKTIHFKFDMFALHYQTAEISIYYIAAITFLLGMIITVFYGMFEWFRLKKQIKDLYKVIRDKDKELNSLRNLPITADNVVSGDADETVK